MRCRLVPTNETRDGRRKHVCERKCGRERWIPEGNVIYQMPPDCQGNVLASDIIPCAMDALGITTAIEQTRIAVWQAKGSPLNELPPGVPSPQLPPPTEGPGTELKKIFAELLISPIASCECDAMANQMNAWGPDGCREHRDDILAHLQMAYDESTVLQALTAGAMAAVRWKPMTLEGLLNLAIERAALTQWTTTLASG